MMMQEKKTECHTHSITISFWPKKKFDILSKKNNNKRLGPETN